MKWKVVTCWEGKYEVSDRGVVRSVTRVVLAPHPAGRIIPRVYQGRVLIAHKTPKGYLHVCLSTPTKKPAHVYVHDLVLGAFVGPKPIGKEARHNDGVPANNQVENLRYDTRSANALDRHKHGTMVARRGREHAAAKLTDEKVKWIRHHIGTISNREMARRLGVCHSTVGLVVRGETWGHIRG